MFWTLIVAIPTIFLTQRIIEYFYPGMIKKEAIKVGWNALQLCSKLEVQASYVINKIKPFLPKSYNETKSFIIFIYEGDEIDKYELDDFLHLNPVDIPPNYDFIIYKLPIKDSDEKQMIRYEKHEDIVELKYNVESEFKFNSIQFSFKNTDKIYNIEFKKNRFMIEGNILFDRKFLQWYLNKYHDAIVQDNDKYIVSFIDHEMNYLTFNETECILINKRKYTLQRI